LVLFVVLERHFDRPLSLMWKPKVKTEPNTQVNSTKNVTDSTVCVICANALVFVSIGSCNHYQVCADCSHRLRFLYSDYRCCVCKQTLDKVVVMQLSKVLSLIPGDQGVKRRVVDQLDFTSLFMEKRTNMFFVEEAVAEKYRSLLKPACSICRETVPSVKALHTHVQVQHGGRLCNICMFYRKAYFVEQIVYDTKKSLDAHIREVHPCCLFCKKNLYDDDQLFEHLTQRHETCPICERNGRLYEYYRDYRSLEQHFKDEHFPCLQENCRGLVFATEFELQLHRQREHTPSNHSRRARTVTIQPSSLYTNAPSREERERQRREFRGARILFTGEGSTVIGSATMNNPGGNSMSRLNRQEQQDLARNSWNNYNSPNNNNNNSDDDDGTNNDTFSSAMQPSNTFIVPRSPSSQEEYDRRNEALLNTLHEILTDDGSYSEFIDISKKLRARQMEPVDYISKAIDILGLLHAKRVLPELISLLGDKPLQKELEQAACSHTMLASRQWITANQQVIDRQWNTNNQRRRRTSDLEESNHDNHNNNNVTEFPSLHNDDPTSQGTSSSIQGFNHNYASGKWKQLSQVVARTNSSSSRPQQDFEVAYPPLSEDSKQSTSKGALAVGGAGVQGVWNKRDTASVGGMKSQVSSHATISQNNNNNNNNDSMEESFPALSSRKTTNEASSSSHSNNLKKGGGVGTRLRGSNLPRVGWNGFSWEAKRNKKVIQAAKNAFKEPSRHS